MWHSINDESPQETGWFLVSTNMGVGFAHYLQSSNEFRDVVVASRTRSSKLKVLHWDKMPEGHPGDFDPDIGGFQKIVTLGY